MASKLTSQGSRATHNGSCWKAADNFLTSFDNLLSRKRRIHDVLYGESLGQAGYRGCISRRFIRNRRTTQPPHDKHDTSETFLVREWSGKAKRMAFNLLG